MNKRRREQISKAIDKLYWMNVDIISIRECEAEAYEKLPESLQKSKKGKTMLENIKSMDKVYTGIEGHIKTLERIIG